MQIDPSNKYHLVGICGDGMSALALVLLQNGCQVVGSDIQESDRARQLRDAGAEVYIGHNRSNLSRDTDSVIISSAISDENVEVQEAERLAIPVHKRLTALADLMDQKRAIGIAGTHGKSTTTTMAASLLEFGGYDPTYMIGADCEKLGGNANVGRGDYFLAEVDESDGHFLQVHPEISVITNVGRDHLDTYQNEEEIVQGFVQFARESSYPIISVDDEHSDRLLDSLNRAFTFGINSPADLRAENIIQRGFNTYFDLRFKGSKVGRVELPAPGYHNVSNALAALSVGYKVGMNFQEMIGLLKEVELPQRRFQVLQNNGSVIIDDYAHLPEEIEVTLEAVKRGWDPERVVAVFQPHRFSRLKHINGQFGSSFKFADEVVVTGIYPAFESPIPGITSQLVIKSINKHNQSSVRKIDDLEEVYDFLEKNIKKGDFLVGLGAGDIWKITHKLARSKTMAVS